MSALEPSDDATAAPVSGDLVSGPEATVVPSIASQNASADRARGRTGLQMGVPTALVNLAVWGARLKGWDLNPLPDSADIPPDAAANLAFLLGLVIAFRMNPKTKAR